MEESSSPTLEQLQQELVQQVIELYRTHLGHKLLHVSCHIVDRTVTIMAEDSITQVEQFLGENQQTDLASQVRSKLLRSLEPHLQLLIERMVGIPVVDVICNSTFETGRTSIVALLTAIPDIPGLDAGRRAKQPLKSDDSNPDSDK